MGTGEKSKRSVEPYYNEYREEERLTSSACGKLEFERSKRIILRFLAFGWRNAATRPI
jgi:hypothetical protein